MKNLKTYDQFINEQTLKDRTEADYLESDWGYHLINDKIEAHLSASNDEIEELGDLPNFSEGKITTFSTKEKGNFVLNCGTNEGKPACRLLDELNNVTTFYIKK